MNDTEKINYHEFSERIRAKYPNEYDDMDDEALAKAVVKKYPEYSDWVQFDKGITDYITGGVPLSSAPGELLKAALAGATGLVAKIPETVQRMADNLAVADYNIPNVYPNYPVNYAPLINQNNQSIPSYPNNYSPQTSHNIQALAPKPILNVDVLGAVSNIAGKASRGIKEWGNETFEAHPALQGSFLDNPSLLKAGALMANAVPSLVGAAAIAAATKSPTFAAGLLGLGDTGDYDEMVSEITKQNIEKGQDEKTARKNAIKQANATMNVEALTSAVWEKYGLEGVLKGGGKLGKRIFTGGAKESGTESGQQITQNIIEKISYDPNRNIFENVPDAAIGAFGSGGLVSAFAGRGNTQNALPPKKDTNVVELDIPPFNPLGNQQKQTTQTQDTQQTENKETQAGDQTQTTQQTQDTDLRGQVIAQEASEIDKKIEAVERRRAKETQKLNNDEAPAQEHQEAIKTIDILDNQINELEKQKNSLLENTQNTGNQQTQTTQAAQTQTANQPTTTNTNEAGVGIFKTETTTQTQTATGQNIDLATKKIDIRIQSVERRRNREVETLNNENISANERNKAAENIKILDNRINRLKERKNNLLENPQGAEILNDIDKTNKLIEKRNRELGELKEQSASGKISQEAYQKRAEQIVRDIERSLTKNEILSGLDEVMRANNTQTQNTAAIEQRIKTLENLIDRSRINGKSILSQKEFRTLQEEYKRTQNMRYKINDGSQQSSIRRAQVANEQTQGAPAQTGTQSTNVNNNETKIEVFNKEKSNEKGAERIKKFAKKIFNKDTAPVIKLLKEKILTENGQKAIGEYVDGVIKVFNGENSDKTFIHESAHYIFDQFLTADEKRILFKQGYREYKAEIDAYRKKYYPNEAITYAIEEVLADKLAEYGVSRQGVSGQIKLIFEAIIRRMKGYVGAQEDIKDFYNSVMSGEVAGQGRNENASSQDRRYNKGISDNENVLALLPPKEYYENPETDYNFPDLNNQDLELLNKKSKPVILKRNIVEKEKVNHKEIPIEQYNEILNGALYNADIIIKDKPQDKPNYYLFVKREIKNGKSVSTLIELNESKENFEIVGWQKLNENSLRYKIKRAGREGGQVLITKRGKPQGAAVLSALSSGKENIAKTDTKNKKPKYQIIGEKGAAALDAAEEATTRLDNLNVAREMEKAGKDARAIRLATGWERGAEGKWRYEIDDVKIEWSINSRTSLKMDLSEFLLDRTSEELFKAYPELAGVRIVVYPSNQKEDGYYDENNNMIFINSASPNPEMTLIHEIQHVIQYIEGFAEGTNLDDTYSELKSERNQALSPVFREALEETGLIDERGELKEEYTNEIGVRFFIFDSQVSDIVYGYKNNDLELIEKKLKILKDYVKKGKVPFVLKRHNERKWIRESDKKKAQEIIEKVEATLEDLEEAAIYGDEMWIRQEAFDRYKRTAGETESRNTEKRALMGKRERLEKMLADTEDVAREDQIILGGAAKGLKSAIEENATERKRYKIENADEAGANKNEVERAKKLWDEMGARSPFFKRWFGDWETSAILKGNSVFDVHSSDIPIINGKIIDTAKAWISEHPIKNISVSTSDGVFDIEVTPNGIQNSFGHTKYKNKIFVLPAIESVIKKGAYLGQAIDTKDKGLKNFYFAAPVKIDGQPNVVFVRIRQMDGDKKRFYVHEVYTQEEIEKEADVLQTVDALKKGLPHGKTPASMYRSIIKNGFDVKNVSKIVDENGEPEVFYHGTQRADRVGSVFRKDRATSGTMAYFTNNKNVAENYSKNKQDTSRLNEETAYTHWFFVNGLDLESYGKTLTRAQNDKLLEKLKHIGYDYENVSYGETSDAMVDPRHWDMVYREKKGNAIMTAVEVFLNDGNMIDNEKKFLEVLKLLGVKEKDITMDFPTEQYPGVYEVYLNIKNPFNTENIPKEIVKQLEQAAKKAPKPEYKEGVDHWDKNSADPKRWITKLKEDINNGTTYAWTSIPDWVSDVLKANGYDGIIDKGGKYNDNPEHKVVIPFESEQIKSVENRGTFDKRNKDIRYKIEEDISKPLTEKEVRNPDRLKNITLITNADTLKNTAGYDDGKAGNMKAAGQLIRNLMSNPARQEKVDDLIRSNPGAIVLGVHAEEAKGRNYIPRKFADYIAKRGKNNGITADKEIVQTNKVGRTGQGEKERIDRMPIFAGKVVKGGKYILTDDLAAMGTTLSALRYYIESNGGEVVGVVTLAGGMFSSQLTPNPKEVVDFDKQLKVEFGISLRNLLKEIGYYDGQEKYLTNRELRAFRRQAIDIKRNRGIEGEQSSLQRALREAIRRHRTTSRLSQEKSNPKNTKPNPKNRPKYKIEKSDKVEKKLSGRQTSLMDDDLDNADNALKSSIDKFDEFDDFGNIDNSLNSAKKIKTFFDVNFRNAKQGIENLSEQAKSIKGFEDNILGLKSRLQGGNAGRVKAALYFNTFKLNAKGNIEITGEGLKPIIDDAIKELKKDGIGAERAFNDLNDYLISQRYVNDLERRGKATENKINAAKKTLSKLTKKYKDLDKFEAIAERLFGFQKRVLSNYVDSGVLSQERFDTILKLNPHYIPLQRVFNDIEKAQGQNLESKSLYAIDPSDLLEKNAFQSIIKNTARIIEFAVQNDIKREIAGLSKDFPDEINKKNFFYERDGASEKASKLTPQEIANESFDLYLKKRAEQRNKITVFHYYDNGKLKFIEVSDPIAAGLRQIPELGRVWKLLTIPTRLLRSGATTFSLRFLVRNPVRDSLVAFMQAKNGFTPIYHSLKGLKSLLTKDEYYKKFLESGGSFGSFMDMSDASLLKFAKSLFNVGGWKQEKWKTVWEYTLGNLEKLNETMEQMTRIGVFKAAKEKGLTDAQAGFEAREATLDFARMGTAIKYANQIVPFLNAGIQGVDTMWRAFKGNKLGFTMKGLLALTLPSMIMEVWYLCYADDDDRDEFLEIPEYERNIYWFFKTKGKWIKIPKPFSLGFIFGSVPERIIESVYKRAQGINDKSAREELWEILMGVIASVSPIQDVGFVIPPIVKVPIENMSNYSFFMERNLYSPYLDKLPASERYNANTSNIAKWIGKNTNTSPAKWDNAIRGFLGTGGADLASLSGGTKQEPILSAVMERDPVGFNSRSVGEFWNKYKKYSEVHAEFKRKAERADNDINDYIRKHSKQLNNYEAARGFYKTITAQSAAIKAIEKSEIPKWKKEEVVRTIGKQMTQQARMANEVMGR